MTDQPNPASTGDFTVEEVDGVPTPPRARVEQAWDAPPEGLEAPEGPGEGTGESAGQKLARKRDYLEGFLQHRPEEVSTTEPGGPLYEAVIDALKDIYDPEIPVNIYDLGLIYGVDVTTDAAVAVVMTLTTPHCPVAESMPGEVELRVGAVPGIGDAEVELVWDPPWDPQKMSDEARLELGML